MIGSITYKMNNNTYLLVLSTYIDKRIRYIYHNNIEESKELSKYTNELE